MPTIAETLMPLRQRIALAAQDGLTGTCQSPFATTTAVVAGHIGTLPAGSLIGAEISTWVGTTNVASATVTGHTVASGVATLTYQPAGTLPTASCNIEVHRLNGRGWTRQEYLNAINAAIDACADLYWTDTETVAWATEQGTPVGGQRRDYPLPSGYNFIHGVDLLNTTPATSNPTGNLDAFRNLGALAAGARLSNGFQVSETGLYRYLLVYLNKVGSPTDNLTCVIETNGSGLPSGSIVTNGTSGNVTGASVHTRPRYVVFTFDPPVLLSADTQYHFSLRRSGAVSAVNYFQAGEDTGNHYSYGQLGTYNSDTTTWTAVSGSDLIFSVLSDTLDWSPLAPDFWKYVSLSADDLHLRYLGAEGVPYRIRGGAAIARVSAETDSIPLRAEWVEAAALAYLHRGKTGKLSTDNHQAGTGNWLQAMGIAPHPRRRIPAHAVQVWT